MNKLLKNTLYVLMLLISTYQAIHAIGHFLDHQNPNTKDYTHLSEHKCSLCHISITPLVPEETSVAFEWGNSDYFQAEFPIENYLYSSDTFRLYHLRAPPIKM